MIRIFLFSFLLLLNHVVRMEWPRKDFCVFSLNGGYKLGAVSHCLFSASSRKRPPKSITMLNEGWTNSLGLSLLVAWQQISPAMYFYTCALIWIWSQLQQWNNMKRRRTKKGVRAFSSILAGHTHQESQRRYLYLCLQESEPGINQPCVPRSGTASNISRLPVRKQLLWQMWLP